MSLPEILKAADFAAKKHRDQRRADPQRTPYINHPIGVAHILTSEGLMQMLYMLTLLFSSIFAQVV